MVVREPYFPKRHKPKLKDTAVRGVLKCLLASRRACSLMCTLDMVMEDNRNGTVSQGAGWHGGQRPEKLLQGAECSRIKKHSLPQSWQHPTQWGFQNCYGPVTTVSSHLLFEWECLLWMVWPSPVVMYGVCGRQIIYRFESAGLQMQRIHIWTRCSYYSASSPALQAITHHPQTTHFEVDGAMIGPGQGFWVFSPRWWWGMNIFCLWERQ